MARNLTLHIGLDSFAEEASGAEAEQDANRRPGDSDIDQSEGLERFITAIETLQTQLSPPDQDRDSARISVSTAENAIRPPGTSMVRLTAKPRRPTTPTHIAAWYGYVPVLEHFLKTQKDVDVADEFGRQPIIVAMQQGHLDAVCICLKHGAHVDLTSTEGQDILLQISQRDSLDKLLVLSIIRKSHRHPDILQEGALPGMDSLLKLPRFVAAVALLSVSPFHGNTENAIRAMHVGSRFMKVYRRLNSDNVLTATGRGDAAAIARMIAKGKWDVTDKKSRLGLMSIFVAVEFGDLDTVAVLIDDGGVDVNIQDSKGNTPLIRASSRGNIAMVKELLARHADVTVRNVRGQSAWSINLQPGNEKGLSVVKKLFQREIVTNERQFWTCWQLPAARILILWMESANRYFTAMLLPAIFIVSSGCLIEGLIHRRARVSDGRRSTGLLATATLDVLKRFC